MESSLLNFYIYAEKECKRKTGASAVKNGKKGKKKKKHVSGKIYF